MIKEKGTENKTALRTRIQTRLDKLYEDRIDGFIEPSFFERKQQEWMQSQARVTEQIANFQDANHNYFEDGVRLFSIQKAKSARKAKIAKFRVFELHLEGSITHCYVPPTV